MLQHLPALPQCLVAHLLFSACTRGTRLWSDKAFYSRSALLPASSNLSSISTSNTSDLPPLSKSQCWERTQKTQRRRRRRRRRRREPLTALLICLTNMSAPLSSACTPSCVSSNLPGSWCSICKGSYRNPRRQTQRENLALQPASKRLTTS